MQRYGIGVTKFRNLMKYFWFWMAPFQHRIKQFTTRLICKSNFKDISMKKPKKICKIFVDNT